MQTTQQTQATLQTLAAQTKHQSDVLIELSKKLGPKETIPGEDPVAWITCAEIYFDVQGTVDEMKVKLSRLALERSRVCVCGDFNAVRSVDELRSAIDGYRPSDHIPFNRFIDDNSLIDLPLCGRKFTWFKGDGRSMSRLDIFLLPGEWSDEEDWGPRPSRMLKCWKDVLGY
ncbi:cysteine-rich receptor-like protein kinase, partial [Trifolium pratense]